MIQRAIRIEESPATVSPLIVQRIS